MWLLYCLLFPAAIAIDAAWDNPEVSGQPHGILDTSKLDLLQETLTTCPDVKSLGNFSIFEILGTWYVTQYYSSSEEVLVYECMEADFQFANGRMDMVMNLKYTFIDDPREDKQLGNMTWTILDPRRPDHWRHTEPRSKVVYFTDVLDTDYASFLVLLHCSDPEPGKRFLSSFILGRNTTMDPSVEDYLREKLSKFNVELEYMFAVNHSNCKMDQFKQSYQVTTSTTTRAPKKKKSRRSKYLYL